MNDRKQRRSKVQDPISKVQGLKFKARNPVSRRKWRAVTLDLGLQTLDTSTSACFSHLFLYRPSPVEILDGFLDGKVDGAKLKADVRVQGGNSHEAILENGDPEACRDADLCPLKAVRGYLPDTPAGAELEFVKSISSGRKTEESAQEGACLIVAAATEASLCGILKVKGACEVASKEFVLHQLKNIFFLSKVENSLGQRECFKYRCLDVRCFATCPTSFRACDGCRVLESSDFPVDAAVCSGDFRNKCSISHGA